MKIDIKYGQLIIVKSYCDPFFNGLEGIVVDRRLSDYRSKDKDSFQYEYGVKLEHNIKYMLESELLLLIKQGE